MDNKKEEELKEWRKKYETEKNKWELEQRKYATEKKNWEIEQKKSAKATKDLKTENEALIKRIIEWEQD